MPGRFTVRPDDPVNGTYGVWDSAVNGWRVQARSEAAAALAATELDIQYDAHGHRSADDIRRLPEPRPAGRIVFDGTVDVWIRDHGKWLGRYRDTEGMLTWIPAEQLRSGGTA